MGRRTKTNPSGLPMQRVTVLYPVETVHNVHHIALEQNVNDSVIWRTAMQEYIKNYVMKGQVGDLTGN